MTDDISTLRSHHIQSQFAAANPKKSVWVSANAGAGKTRVLVDRIIRMMLPPFHALPHKILCMTFTKAAATEMSQRLFDRLGGWIALSDDELSAELQSLTGERPDKNTILMARRLFALALETPGGLKIQTIHGFCEQILRKFPVESGTPTDFKIIQDGDILKIFKDSLDIIAKNESAKPDSLLIKSMEQLSLVISPDELLLFFKNSRKIYIECQNNQKPFWDSDALQSFLELSDMHNPEQMTQKFIDDLDWDNISAVISACESSKSKTDIEMAENLTALMKRRTMGSDGVMNGFEEIFLTQKSTLKKTIVTKDIDKKFPHLYAFIYNVANDFMHIYTHKQRLDMYEMTQYISVLMMAVYTYYDMYKQENSLFDYDDLIQKTRSLLLNSDVSAWVLYKLDGGLSHILVDEAQDTAPEQWDIVRALSEEFFTTDDNTHIRTVFAVGDEKQSIYGFQGADPYQMSKNKQYFSDILEHNPDKWGSESLHGSFRSAPAIMAFVDKVFESGSPASSGVTFDDNIVRHYAVANAGPGYIRVNPPVMPEKTDDESVWTMALDAPPVQSAKAILVKNVVTQIKELLGSGQILPSTQQAVCEKDILILLRKRGTLQNLLIKELKKQNIPVAGADRISLLDDIAVLDLLALIDFVLLTDDDLSLACVLKSPLCGLTEQELFTLCHGRTHSLWVHLMKHHTQSDIFTKAFLFLKAVLSKADFLPPYDFLEYILLNLGGRKKFHAALGDECLDAIDELLNKSLTFERDISPSLQNFVHYIRNYGAEIKRDPEISVNQIRIMTVHGAKGLESPIVFLPDCAAAPKSEDLHNKIIYPDGVACPLWLRGKIQSDNIDMLKDQMKQSALGEDARLLYVALTRAKDHIYIDGVLSKPNKEGGKVTLSETSWYAYIISAMKKMDNVVITPPYDDAPYMIYEYFDVGVTVREKTMAVVDETDYPMPDWLKNDMNKSYIPTDFDTDIYDDAQPADIHYTAPSNVVPNLNAQNPQNILQYEQMMRGVMLHKILEIIPYIDDDKRTVGIKNFFAQQNISDTQKEIFATEIVNLLSHPDLKDLFSPHGVSEVPIVGRLSHYNHIFINGQIDRMVILPDKIMIADYKTDRGITSDSVIKKPYMLQMGLYHAALSDLYPDKQIDVYIIGTAHNVIRFLDNQMLKQYVHDYAREKQKTAKLVKIA